MLAVQALDGAWVDHGFYRENHWQCQWNGERVASPYVCFKHTLGEFTFPSGRILAFSLTYNLFRALRARARGLA